MKNRFKKLVHALIGDPRHNSLEHRLFNSLSLLNGFTNIAGAFNPASNYYSYLFILNVGVGVLFLVFYYFSRFRRIYHVLYWPFMMTILVFLFFNILGNAGSMGGTHYYYIPALLIATILSRSAWTTAAATVVTFSFSLAVFYIETNFPELIVMFKSPEERLYDVAGQFVFVQLFTGILVLILKNHFNDERHKSDRLLLNILPIEVAEELKKTDKVMPMHYDATTVLFTDMVGFTKIAESMTPSELIEELDECFRRFDAITRKHHVEKIKTIGDAYMAVGGLPEVNHSHPIDTVLAALEMQAHMAALKKTHMEHSHAFWEIRVGIHTGPLIAGVVGTEKFAYDVWGDTVNTASRMESSGAAGKINVSQTTYDLVKEYFVCEYRGKLAAKNKGEIDMYFVERLKPEYSADGLGIKPNTELENYLSERRFFHANKAIA